MFITLTPGELQAHGPEAEQELLPILRSSRQVQQIVITSRDYRIYNAKSFFNLRKLKYIIIIIIIRRRMLFYGKFSLMCFTTMKIKDTQS